MWWEFVFDHISTFSLPHTRVDFLSASMICSLKKSSPLTMWRDEISYSHAIPWTQDKRSGNLLYPSRSPAFSSHFLALFTFISEARSQLVCGPSFSMKSMSFLISRVYFTNFISCPFPHWSLSSLHTDLFQVFKETKLPPATGLLHTLFCLPVVLHPHPIYIDLSRKGFFQPLFKQAPPPPLFCDT